MVLEPKVPRGVGIEVLRPRSAIVAIRSQGDSPDVQRIAIDMDEVLADTAGHQLAWYNRDFGTQLTADDLRGRHFHTVVPQEHRAGIKAHLFDPTFFRDIPLMPGAIDAVRVLSERYELFVASAAMEHPVSFTAKYEWLREHFPDIPASRCIFCGDKSIVGADYLIDDSPYQLATFRGESIIFTAPHNVHETRFRRVLDWPDAVSQLMAAA